MNKQQDSSADFALLPETKVRTSTKCYKLGMAAYVAGITLFSLLFVPIWLTGGSATITPPSLVISINRVDYDVPARQPTESPRSDSVVGRVCHTECPPASEALDISLKDVKDSLIRYLKRPLVKPAYIVSLPMEDSQDEDRAKQATIGDDDPLANLRHLEEKQAAGAVDRRPFNGGGFKLSLYLGKTQAQPTTRTGTRTTLPLKSGPCFPPMFVNRYGCRH